MTCYSPSRYCLSSGLVALGWPRLHPGSVFSIRQPGLLRCFSVFPPSFCLSLPFSRRSKFTNTISAGTADYSRGRKSRYLTALLDDAPNRQLDATGDRRVLLVYPGDIDAGKSLLRHLRRCAKDALIDGIPYRQFWGEVLPGGSDRRPTAFAAVSASPSRGRS